MMTSKTKEHCSGYIMSSKKNKPFISLYDPTKSEILEFNNISYIPSREELTSLDFYVKSDPTTFILPLRIPEITSDDNLVIHEIGLVVSEKHCILLRYDDYLDIDTDKQSGVECYLSIVKQLIYELRSTLTSNIQINISYLSNKVFNYDINEDDDHRKLLKSLGKISDYVDSMNILCLRLKKSLECLKTSFNCEDNQDIFILEKEFETISETISMYNNKINFLLDSTLGFINVDQNNTMKILTIVSSVLILPTLIAGIFGMNFAHIPWGDNTYGFMACVGIMIVIIIIPLMLFWHKGWLKLQ